MKCRLLERFVTWFRQTMPRKRAKWRCRLVFLDWQDAEGRSIYTTEPGVWLSMGALHSGTTFEAEIDFDEDDRRDIAEGLAQDCTPVFYLLPEVHDG